MAYKIKFDILSDFTQPIRDTKELQERVSTLVYAYKDLADKLERVKKLLVAISQAKGVSEKDLEKIIQAGEGAAGKVTLTSGKIVAKGATFGTEYEVSAVTQQRFQEERLKFEERLIKAGYDKENIAKKLNEFDRVAQTDIDAFLAKQNILISRHAQRYQLIQRITEQLKRHPELVDQLNLSEIKLSRLKTLQLRELADQIRMTVIANTNEQKRTVLAEKLSKELTRHPDIARRIGVEKEKLATLSFTELKAVEQTLNREKDRQAVYLKRMTILHSLGYAMLRTGKQIEQTGIVMVAAISATVREAVRFNLEMVKLISGTNISIKQGLQLAMVAESAGVPIQQLTKGVNNFYQALLTAGQGTSLVAARVREVLTAVGMTPVRLGQQPIGVMEFWDKIREVYQSLSNAQDKAYIGQRVFGQAYEEFIPILEMSAETWNKLKGIADSFWGSTLPRTEEFNKRVIDLNANFIIWRNTFRLVGMELMESLSPVFQSIGTHLSKLIHWFSSLSPEIRRAISFFTVFGALGLLVAGRVIQVVGALFTLIGALKQFSFISSGILSLMSPLNATLLGLATILAGVAVYMSRTNLQLSESVKTLERETALWKELLSVYRQALPELQRLGQAQSAYNQMMLLYHKRQELIKKLSDLSGTREERIRVIQEYNLLPSGPIDKIGSLLVNHIRQARANILKELEALTEMESKQLDKLKTVTQKKFVPSIMPSTEDVAKEFNKFFDELQRQVSASRIKETIQSEIELIDALIAGVREKVKQTPQWQEVAQAKINDLLARRNLLEERCAEILREANSLLLEFSTRAERLPRVFSEVTDMINRTDEAVAKLAQVGTMEAETVALLLKEQLKETIPARLIEFQRETQLALLKSERERILAAKELREQDAEDYKRNLARSIETERVMEEERFKEEESVFLTWANRDVINQQERNAFLETLHQAHKDNLLKIEEEYQEELTRLNTRLEQEEQRREREREHRVREFDRKELKERIKGKDDQVKVELLGYTELIDIYKDYKEKVLLNEDLSEEEILTRVEETEDAIASLLEKELSRRAEIYQQEGRIRIDALEKAANELMVAYPEYFSDIFSLLEAGRQKEKKPQPEWYTDWENNLERIRVTINRSLPSIGDAIKDVVSGIPEAFAESFAGVLTHTNSFVKSFGSAIRRLTQMVWETLVKLAMQILASRIIMWIFSFLRIGGQTPFPAGLNVQYEQAMGATIAPVEVPSFQHGGVVPILAHAGELVVPQWKTRELIARLDSSGAGTGHINPANVNLHFNISAIDTQSAVEFILKNRSAIASSIQMAVKENHPIRRS